MNNNIKNTLRTGVMAVVGLAVMAACSDMKNEHYNDSFPMSEDLNLFSGTTMQALEQNASDFAQIVKATGFDVYLNSPSAYTVWAPANGTFNKDSVLSLLETNKNAVLNQFVKNHVALYPIPLNLESHEINLLNKKLYTMSSIHDGNAKIGNNTIYVDQSNVKCDNGILHVINGNLTFKYNLFELIESEYNKSTNSTKADVSLYAFLLPANEDSLIEAQSVYRGYDDYGNKIWVDSVTLRNNTILRDMDALLYEEDSSYIALIPTVEAYQGRYEEIMKYLEYNPSMDTGLEYSRVDSLKKNYANRFALADLFYNRNANEFWNDSLKSTQYNAMQWPNHLYYRVQPRVLPGDKEVNDILSKVGLADSITCSNGIAYVFNEYPISIYEQFFKNIKMSNYEIAARYIDKETKTKGSNQNVTKNVGDTENIGRIWSWTRVPILKDENGEDVYETDPETGVQYPVYDESQRESGSITASGFYVPASGLSNPSIGFNIPDNFSGQYDIYLVTMRNWAYLFDWETNRLRYRFRASIWEKDEKGDFPSAGTPLEGNTTFEVPSTADEMDDVSVMLDTTKIGSYTFKYAYYGETEPGVILQVTTNLLSSHRKTFSYNMIFSEIILKPHQEEESTDPAAKRRKVSYTMGKAKQTGSGKYIVTTQKR